MASSSRSEPVARVGFVGLGDMGGAIATRIIAAGWPTVLWARRAEAVEPFRAPNVETAGTPATLAAAADLIGVCVWTDDDVREVVAGANGLLAGCRPGTVIVVHSTVLPATCREVVALAERAGVCVVDAPVTGGRDVALAGALTVAVGGDPAAVARCRPVFDAFAGTVVHFGAVGTGQTAKLLNNALFAANLAVADDALTLGEALGLDVAALRRFLADGSGRSYALDVAERMQAAPAMRAAALPALEKDVHALAAESAEKSGAGLALHDAAMDALRRLRVEPLD